MKPDGVVIALEAQGHNPLINWYRYRTPELRSPDEHALLSKDIDLARNYFEHVEVKYFGLATLAASPLWKTPLIGPARNLLEVIDSVLLRIPFVKRQARIIAMLLRKPKENPS